MRQIEVTIHLDWPYLILVANLPGGRVIKDKAVWHIAASQFAPKVQQAFQQTIDDLIKVEKEKRNIPDGTTQR